jgi:hypothetical protein
MCDSFLVSTVSLTRLSTNLANKLQIRFYLEHFSESNIYRFILLDLYGGKERPGGAEPEGARVGAQL